MHKTSKKNLQLEVKKKRKRKKQIQYKVNIILCCMKHKLIFIWPDESNCSLHEKDGKRVREE